MIIKIFFMNNNRLFIVLSACLILLSCQKIKKGEQSSEQKALQQMVGRMASNMSQDTLENYVFLLFNKMLLPLQNFDSVHRSAATVAATFNDASENPCSVGNLYINNNSFSPSSDNHYYYNSIEDMTSGSSRTMNADLRTLYGQDVNVKIDGNNLYSAFSTTVHVPLSLDLSASLPYGGSYIQGSDLTLTWTADPNNNMGNVLIRVYYYSAESKRENSSNPDSIQTLQYIVPDNGSYTIPATTLNAFPLSSYMGFSIARANQYKVTSTNSGKYVYIYPIVEVSSGLIKVTTKPLVYARLEQTQNY